MKPNPEECGECSGPLLIGDYCPRCGGAAEPCEKCNGDGIYCRTCGERERSCECLIEEQNLGDCDTCSDEE